MPTISFKKDEARLLSALLDSHRVGLSDRVHEYEKLIEAGEADYYDGREYERAKEAIESTAKIAVKLARAIYRELPAKEDG